MFFLLDKSNIKNISFVNFVNKVNKRGQALAADEDLKWIIYIAVLAAAIFGVWHIASKVFG